MYKYLIAFTLYMFLIVAFLFDEYNEKIDIYHNNLAKSVDKSFNGALNTFELLNDSYHNRIESKMAKIIKNATTASTKERDAIRYKLRENFTNLYNNRKLANLDTFQVLDKNCRSILRFHQLDRYDDSLSDARKSLKRLSSTFRSQHGFEIGKYSTTYRFEYPLFYDGDFVGSYEFGIDFNAIDSEMQKIFSIKNILFIHEDNVNKYLIKQDLKYKNISIGKEKFYMLKTELNAEFQKSLNILLKLKIMPHEISCHKISFIEFSVDSSDYTAIITPINDINDKHIGFILTGVIDNVTCSIKRAFFEELIISILFGVVVLFLIYKELEYKKYIRNIIDTQHDILIVTDGQTIHDANKKFLEFFDYKRLNEFKENHSCICDHFVNENGYLKKDMDGISWFDYIKEHTDKENIAVMYDKNNEKRYFDIQLEGFSHSKNFIMILSDITEALIFKEELKNKAYYDDLTKIYSRQSFDYYLNDKLEKDNEFSIIMFDIDHFKAVNDNYGHDVGDSVLIELTTLVSSHIRKDDIFARWGGEEFMIILNSNIEVAEKFANKLRIVIELHQFKYVEKMTCSFGVSKSKIDDNSAEILKRVDRLLYSAKESGRNCVVALS